MKKLIAAHVAVIAYSLAPNAIAQSANDDGVMPVSGVYLGATVGRSTADANVFGSSIALDVFDEIFNFSGSVFLGYRIYPWVSVEAGYNSYVNSDTGIGRETASFTLDSWSLTAKFSYPVTPWFSPYFRIGPDWVRQKSIYNGGGTPRDDLYSNERSFVLQTGLGTDFILARRYTISLNWKRDVGNGKIEGFSDFNLGFSYTF
ncbi:Uncharacterised protein [BD1-7 clade bacterium]|uniref:Outer membrane protein beta-barrel domain-containing protein n=1 Tax=BD1-7 clade bacterium TaxID=2029982 RepID=A0A5S9NLJ0_9GAMM|nr:Uncharacterised protein [BD1-7 clade bacterium]CAA0093940.1 Uncharacterised protein [BD1-7 clade bacterium]